MRRPGCYCQRCQRCRVRGERFAAIDRHPQLALEGGSPVVEARGFDDRAAAVAYARRRSELGTPCDVFDAWGELIYTNEMALGVAS